MKNLKREQLKRYTYHLLHERKWVTEFIYGLIMINVIALIFESYKEIRESFGLLFQVIEVFSVLVFTIEYLLRIWVADINEEHHYSRLKFIFSPLGLVDLIAILPFYLPMIFKIDLRVMRILRLFRLLRIFKLGRFSKSLKTINKVMSDIRADLAITIFIVFILLIISSTLMYYVEGEAQPDKFGSIGHALWWAVATLTTVGYGDVYPITGVGKLLSGVIALIGIGFVALPTGIISSAFIEEIRKKKEAESSRKCQCPHCGARFEIDQAD